MTNREHFEKALTVYAREVGLCRANLGVLRYLHRGQEFVAERLVLDRVEDLLGEIGLLLDQVIEIEGAEV